MSEDKAGNMDASSVFSQALAIQVNQQDVEIMIQAQKHMMSRFEKTSEMLINCNALSAVRLYTVNQEFKRHTSLLTDMMKDLDTIFKRIRNLKQKFSSQYPDAFKACSCYSPIKETDETTKDLTDTVGRGNIDRTADFKLNTTEVCKNTDSASLGIPDKVKLLCQSSSCSRSSSPPSLATSTSTSDSG